MPKYAHPDVLDQGPNFIKSNCNKVALVPTFATTDTYAAVNAAILAEATMASADFVFANSGANRTLTTASGKTDTSANASGGGAGNHLVFLDTVNSKILWATPETSGQSITAGNPVSFPSLVYTAQQPV